MTAVRIENEAFSDERYDDLAAAAGLVDADHARGKMARLWRQCTIEQTHTLPNVTVQRVLGPNAVTALEAARLGERVNDTHVRIRGTRGRIEWLKKLRDNGKFGRRGGRPKKNPRGLSSENPDGHPDGFPSKTPLTLTLTPSLSSSPTPVPSPLPEKSPAPAEPSPHQRAIDEFDAYYRRTHGGAKPTWNGAICKRVKDLVGKHGVHEVVRRISVLERSPPRFPPAPWDASTFLLHFDKCAQPPPVDTRSASGLQHVLDIARGDA